MLAYVFWHQRAGSVTPEAYETGLRAFHRSLRERSPAGFLGSMVPRVAGLPWITDEGDVYEDWYLIENSAALDTLDQAAVTGICQVPHDEVARLASKGTGGLYRLLRGNADFTQLATLRYMTWFDKPPGMSYQQLSRLLSQAQVEQQGVLWQRQLTMGPAREFCLHSAQKSTLPEEIAHLSKEARLVFGPSSSS